MAQKFKKFGKLPGKPSALIALALKDFMSVRRSSKFKINMCAWMYRTGEGTCAVCLAGAVMARTLKCDTTVTCISYEQMVNLQLAETLALSALDMFRQGRVHSGLDQLNLRLPEEVPDQMYIVPYDESPVKFMNDMKKLAALLKKHNL